MEMKAQAGIFFAALARGAFLEALLRKEYDGGTRAGRDSRRTRSKSTSRRQVSECPRKRVGAYAP